MDADKDLSALRLETAASGVGQASSCLETTMTDAAPHPFPIGWGEDGRRLGEGASPFHGRRHVCYPRASTQTLESGGKPDLLDPCPSVSLCGWKSLLRVWCGILLFLGAVSTSAQDLGSVSGLVVSAWDGAPLSGAVITVRGTTLAIQTGGEGRFLLNGVPLGDQVLRLSKSGYAAATVTEVRVLPGQTTTVNGNLRPEFYEMEEFEVTAEEFNEQTAQILFERQQSGSLLDAIGSEQFSKLGASDAAEALSKVTGASIADGKFAVIRGLADRYTSTTLNGVDVPSADPDRKAAQLDLFPSQFIERIDVSKTFTPDMPGGFAGGAINIVTKSFPKEFFFSMSVGVSYNTQSNLKDDFAMGDHGSTDWLGLDDGKRELPEVAKNTNPAETTSPLGEPIKSSFGSGQFAPRNGSSPLNDSFALTSGDTVEVLGGRRLGYLAGLNHKNDYKARDLTVSKYEVVKRPDGSQDLRRFEKQGTEGDIEYTSGAMVAPGLEISENHTVKFNFLKVQAAEDEAVRVAGQDKTLETEPGISYADQSTLHWTERSLDYFQLTGAHEFPWADDMRFDWAAATSSTTQDEPDHRIFQFFAVPGDPTDPTDDYYDPNGPTRPARPTRIFRKLREDNSSVRGDITVPIPSYNSKDTLFKTGYNLSHSKRDYEARVFDIRPNGRNTFYTTGDPDDYAAPENYGTIGYYNFPANFRYKGQQEIVAGYLMSDWSALEWLRLIGGVRYEVTSINVSTINVSKGGETFSGAINQADLLPGVTATISIRSNLLLRAAWSQTVIRPNYREISRAEDYDVAKARTIVGNPDLQMSQSENYDLRLEWFPTPGALVSVGVFLKKLTDPIELASRDNDVTLVYYRNYAQADVRGVEFEVRQDLGTLWPRLDELSAGFNYAFIQSTVDLTPEQLKNRRIGFNDTSTTRPLYDQPEFVINGDITWDHKPSGTSLTLSGGVVGRRLVLVGYATPDEYEEPTPQLDVFLTQKLGKHWKIKLSAKNLLDPVYETTQDYLALGRHPIESYRTGQTYGLSVSYDF
jgi:outer membrane receptor protein involved in Fe transport